MTDIPNEVNRNQHDNNHTYVDQTEKLHRGFLTSCGGTRLQIYKRKSHIPLHFLDFQCSKGVFEVILKLFI